MPRIQPVDTRGGSRPIEEAFRLHAERYHARITNMKRTLGHSLVAFEVYMEWYRLYDEVKKITGGRMAYLYAYAISYAADCPLCTTFFRKIIIDAGEKPEDIKVTEPQQKLLTFGSAIASTKGIISDDVYQQVSALYTDAELVTLIAFAGQMIATNIFNNVIGTSIDDYLDAYLPPEQTSKNE